MSNLNGIDPSNIIHAIALSVALTEGKGGDVLISNFRENNPDLSKVDDNVIYLGASLFVMGLDIGGEMGHND